MWKQRTELLIGNENLLKLENSHVAIFGLGGVGGFVVEALARVGVGTFTIVDFDTIDITNINRQLIATTETIGQSKVELFKKRILSINPKAKIFTYKKKFFKDEEETFFKEKKYDYIVDAIDIIKAKLDLIELAYKYNIKIISSMGAGNKLDPTKFEVADINKTSVCPLARVIRKELKSRNIKKLKVVYSKEQAKKPNNLDGGREKYKNVGSVSFVPSAMGLILAAEVVKDICDF